MNESILTTLTIRHKLELSFSFVSSRHHVKDLGKQRFATKHKRRKKSNPRS